MLVLLMGFCSFLASGKFCTTNIHQELHKHQEFDTNLRQALEDTLYRIDRQMKITSAVYGCEHIDDPSVYKHSGSLPVKEIPFCGGISASIALIRGADSIIATIGSALCFISKDGKPNRLGTGSNREGKIKTYRRQEVSSWVCCRLDNYSCILTCFQIM
uniref:protein-serine/threonine phosphatase n=2 Tax=Aegilops tauschii subsp. strangulata TaxID=200361 RepID=A0A453FCL2_AEGTS